MRGGCGTASGPQVAALSATLSVITGGSIAFKFIRLEASSKAGHQQADHFYKCPWATQARA